MGAVDIRTGSVRLFPHAARLEPEFASRPVLSPDPFAYVRLKLQRGKQTRALIYWQQAEEFFQASSALSDAASALTSYYCMLNAVKALLTVRSHKHSDSHGLRGKHSGGAVSLAKETVCVASGGVFPALAALYGDPVGKNAQFTLRDLLSEMPFVHRSFTLTYTKANELFVPLEKARFVRKESSSEAWFTAHIPPSYAVQPFQLPDGFERDGGAQDVFVVRCKRRFSWDDSDIGSSLLRLRTYHNRLQAEVVPILTTHANRWYLRKSENRGPAFSLPLTARIFAAMHRLSELSRYDPVRLRRHLEAKHNWLVSEFLSQAPAQLVHLVARELTGREIVQPDSLRLPAK